ncbi:MAG: OmpA family protein [Bacteroidetes bacterium]|nr:OmpA family protein [Bacteroidota bacterium]
MGFICIFQFNLFHFSTIRVLKLGFLFGVLAAFQLQAQNLVPNGNFEAGSDRYVENWVQPPGEFYHYEDMWLDTNGTKYYNHINGLCLIQPMASEYMYVKLKAPIKKDKRYCLKMKLYFKGNDYDRPEWLKTVHLAFLNEGIALNRRLRLRDVPDLVIDLDTLSERPFFQYVEQRFTAKRTGEYLYLGRFFEDEVYEVFDRWELEEKEILEERNEFIKYLKDSFNSRTIEFDEPKSKRDLKKQIRILTDFTRVNAYTRDTTIRFYQRWYKAYTDSLKDARLKQYYFHVRTYFDDICISEELLDGTCSCSDSMPLVKYKTGDLITLKNIFFDLDKSSLKQESEEELQRLFLLLTERSGLQIRIQGHTDSINSAAYNQKLSANRAKRVMDWLIAKGISPNRLSYQGFGESKPIAPNDTEQGRAMNRRVEFVILKGE